MKKRERVPIRLFVENGVSKASLKDENKVTNTKNIIGILDELSKTNLIVNAKKIKKENFVDYVYDIDDEESYSIVIRVDNREKNNHYEVVKYLDALCNLSISLKKVNRTRFVAGLAIGTLILVAMGPTMAKTMKQNNDANIRNTQEKYEEFLENTGYYDHHYPTEEERKIADQAYYEYLKEKAEAGDQKAKEEYENYCLEKMLLDNFENESKIR